MKYVGIAVKQEVKYTFVQHVFNVHKDGILCQKMIHKLVHLIELPYLEINQRIACLNEGNDVLSCFRQLIEILFSGGTGKPSPARSGDYSGVTFLFQNIVNGGSADARDLISETLTIVPLTSQLDSYREDPELEEDDE